MCVCSRTKCQGFPSRSEGWRSKATNNSTGSIVNEVKCALDRCLKRIKFVIPFVTFRSNTLRPEIIVFNFPFWIPLYGLWFMVLSTFCTQRHIYISASNCSRNKLLEFPLFLVFFSQYTTYSMTWHFQTIFHKCLGSAPYFTCTSKIRRIWRYLLGEVCQTVGPL